MASTPAPTLLFISYSHKDEALREKLGAHLSLLKHDRVIDEWHDRRIGAGREWAGEIDEHLNSSDVILLLVSADFLASDYCYNIEMTRALERHDAGDARVIPVILRSADWQGAPFAKLQALPKGGKAVTSWANEDEAFTDVARGIRAVLQDLAPTAHARRSHRLPAIWKVPYLRNPHFAGRDDLLDELHAKLTDGRVALTAVRGMGGVGKTQLALEYSYRHAGDFDLLWWLRAEEPATLLEDYAALAAPLGIAASAESELAAVAEAARDELTRRERWLLVFDNANLPEDLEPLLPKAAAGRVLITSRNPSWPFAASLDVPTLDRGAAVSFLLARTGQDDACAAGALADALGDLPLALEQAAAYMAANGLGLADYLSLFQSRRSELWSEEEPATGYPATVGTTWTMAVECLRTEQPLAVDLLDLCAFLAPEAIPRRLFAENHEALPADLAAAVADPLRLNRLVGALRRYSLVDVTSDALSFHRLVQAAAQDALEPADHRRWVEAAVALMQAGFPHKDDDPATWVPSGAMLAHALAAAGHAERTARDLMAARQLLRATADYLEIRAELARAKDGYTRALKLAEDALDADHAEVATYANNLGYVLRQQGDFPAARASYERALHIDETTYGPDHPNVAITVSNLGLVLQAQGDLPAARTSIERALHIDETTYGLDHPNVAITVNNLAGVLRAEGDLPAARASFERALHIDETTYGPDHPKVAIRLNNLATVVHDLGDLPAACASYERALRIFETAYGPDHPNVARAINNLGLVLKAQGDLPAARASSERALHIDETTYGPDHPEVARDVNNLASGSASPGRRPSRARSLRARPRALRAFPRPGPSGHADRARQPCGPWRRWSRCAITQARGNTGTVSRAQAEVLGFC